MSTIGSCHRQDALAAAFSVLDLLKTSALSIDEMRHALELADLALVCEQEVVEAEMKRNLVTNLTQLGCRMSTVSIPGDIPSLQ